MTLVACRVERLPRFSQVDRELRVTAPSNATVDRWFATLHALQSELGMAETRRSTTQAILHAAFELPPNATIDLASAALQRAMRNASVERVPFRVRANETQRAARTRWEEYLVTDDAAQRRAAFAIMESTMEVEFVLTAAERQSLTAALGPVERHLRRVAALGATMVRMRELAADLLTTLPEVSRGATPAMAPEFRDAQRFLESVAPKVELQIQESRRTELWLRGVFVPGGEDMSDAEFIEELNRLHE
ncbi:MAG: hypothetical protein JNK72_21130 [Myxococcales bacterium]|nr:hypothetical protein [Myxococcales bacterium]